MEQNNIEKWFNIIDHTSIILQQELHVSYLEAVALTGDNVFEGAILQEELTPNEIITKKLQKEYNSLHIERFSKEEIRKGYQLAILKGMKDSTQSHHQMTPDAVALFVSFLVNKLTKNLEELTILDPAAGTGNLLTAVLNQLTQKDVKSLGIEIDDLLVKLGFINANLQEHPTEFFNQDALQDLFIDPVDITICDLPVGYYPNDLGAEKFELRNTNGHSLAHHLFIEQSFRYTKEGGTLLFVVPNKLFEGEHASQLHGFIKEHGVILGLLQLPLSMFKSEDHAKSIFMLRKKGFDVTPPKQALLANLPSFSNKNAMQGMIGRIEQWFNTQYHVSSE
ncbi:class I SAM-dependent methyltransferase [Bacillus salitolerans]|uniref:Class I SAM-dependent methyltransferase n=1 Tax=Bacillus salitolerans TaxID=1437434 RepID=A0ABW4LYP4_9BACI